MPKLMFSAVTQLPIEILPTRIPLMEYTFFQVKIIYVLLTADLLNNDENSARHVMLEFVLF